MIMSMNIFFNASTRCKCTTKVHVHFKVIFMSSSELSPRRTLREFTLSGVVGIPFPQASTNNRHYIIWKTFLILSDKAVFFIVRFKSLPIIMGFEHGTRCPSVLVVSRWEHLRVVSGRAFSAAVLWGGAALHLILPLLLKSNSKLTSSPTRPSPSSTRRMKAALVHSQSLAIRECWPQLEKERIRLVQASGIGIARANFCSATGSPAVTLNSSFWF